MTSRTMTFETVKEIGLALPGVEEGTTYGAPSLKVGGQFFTCLPTHRSAEPNSLAIRIGFAQRDELLAADPDTYYVKEHYVNYPVVLVRLARIHRDALRDLLAMAWRFVGDKARRTRAPRSRASRDKPKARR